MERLERFRAAMKRLGSTAAEDDFADDLVVEEPEFMCYSRLGAALALSGGLHLLIGGIGTGKTTQLRLLERRPPPPIIPTIIRWQPVFDVHSGSNARMFDPHVDRWLSAFAEQLIRSADRSWSYSGIELRQQIARALKPDNSAQAIDGSLREPAVAERLEAALSACGSTRNDVVFLIDGTERQLSPKGFASLVDSVTKELIGEGFSAVIVAPLELSYDAEPEFFEPFAQVHFQEALRVADDPKAQAFMMAVLQRRLNDESLIHEDLLRRLVEYSSGIHRDALHLVRIALNAAYASGRDEVMPVHVQIAVDEFAQKLLLGVSGAQLSDLRTAVIVPEEFVPQRAHNLELLRHRLIVRYLTESGRQQFRVHAAVENLLARRNAA